MIWSASVAEFQPNANVPLSSLVFTTKCGLNDRFVGMSIAEFLAEANGVVAGTGLPPGTFLARAVPGPAGPWNTSA